MNTAAAVTSLKLPFQFAADLLKKEVSNLFHPEWIDHFNSRDYQGSWKVIPLYATDGNQTNIYAMNGGNLQPTPILDRCPYLRAVIDEFEAPLISARLMRLASGSYIKPHRDHNLGYEDGNFRLHVPIITHEKVKFIIEDNLLPMKAGECWYTNVNCLHSVANDSAIDRIHLVLDYERNAWSDEIFFSLVSPDRLLPVKEEKYSLETMKQMISELGRIEGEGAAALISALTAKIELLEAEAGRA